MPSAPAPAPSEAPPWEEKTEQAPALQEKKDSAPASSETDKPEGTSCRTSAGGGDWSALVERCKGRLPPMYRPFLGMCVGTAGDGVLTVYAPDDITLNRLDNDRVRTALQEEAQAEWGTALRVVLQVGQPPAVSTEENLKNLLAFGSQFDNFEIK